MSRPYRFVALTLGLGLLLALMIVYFIPEEIPGLNSRVNTDTSPQPNIKNQTDAELLRGIDDEMKAIDTEYSFDEDLTEESLSSPTFNVEATK